MDRVEPVDLQVEMQRSYLDYAMSVIVGRALPDVRDGLKPVHRRVLYAMYDGGYRPDRGFSKCSTRRRRRHGQLPPARRHRDLRHPRPARAAVVDALPPHLRAGQLRLAGQRPGRGDALHRVPAGARWPWRWCATSTRRRSTSSPNYDGRDAGAAHPAEPLPEPARQRLRRHRRRHGDEHAAAQPARGRVRGAVVPRAPAGVQRGAARRADAAHPRSGLPDRCVWSSGGAASRTRTAPVGA